MAYPRDPYMQPAPFKKPRLTPVADRASSSIGSTPGPYTGPVGMQPGPPAAPWTPPPMPSAPTQGGGPRLAPWEQPPVTVGGGGPAQQPNPGEPGPGSGGPDEPPVWGPGGTAGQPGEYIPPPRPGANRPIPGPRPPNRPIYG